MADGKNVAGDVTHRTAKELLGLQAAARLLVFGATGPDVLKDQMQANQCQDTSLPVSPLPFRE